MKPPIADQLTFLRPLEVKPVAPKFSPLSGDCPKRRSRAKRTLSDKQTFFIMLSVFGFPERPRGEDRKWDTYRRLKSFIESTSTNAEQLQQRLIWATEYVGV